MAAITSYDTLVSAIARYASKSAGSTYYDEIPTFIANTEARVFGELRVSRMIQRDTATIDTTNQFSAVPSNYLETITYSLSDGTNSYRLDPAPIEVIASYRASNDTAGIPRFYGINGTSSGREFEHYPTPDASYTGTLTFYAKPDALSASNASNWVLVEAPDVYLYGALLEGSIFMLDEDSVITKRSAAYTAALDRLSRLERTKAGKLRTDIGLTSRRGGLYDITRDF